MVSSIDRLIDLDDIWDNFLLSEVGAIYEAAQIALRKPRAKHLRQEIAPTAFSLRSKKHRSITIECKDSNTNVDPN